MKLNISIDNILIAVFLSTCVILISLIPSGIIRVWVFSSAFEKYSKQHIKKIRSEHTIWQKMNILYLTKYENTKKTKRRVTAYWIYWIIILLSDIISFLSAIGFFHYSILEFVFFPLGLFDIIIWIVWSQRGKKII